MNRNSIAVVALVLGMNFEPAATWAGFLGGLSVVAVGLVVVARGDPPAPAPEVSWMLARRFSWRRATPAASSPATCWAISEAEARQSRQACESWRSSLIRPC